MGSWNGFEQPIGPLAVGSTINTRLPLEAVTSPSCMFQKRVRKTLLPLSRFEKQISAGFPRLKPEIPFASIGHEKPSCKAKTPKLQGSLAYKKPPPPRTQRKAYP